ncbi:hypothetical protein AB0M54_45940 [Actinoplanes sp. NPDC051470]|uniref:hypothetical protein n=1 Tax=Actinoplanes sp. NPDC051470 TaxID=3157224 RepID=UPI003418ADCE
MSNEAPVPEPPAPGQVFALRPEDYDYGEGHLIAHIKEVLTQLQHEGEPWWNVVAEVVPGTLISHGEDWLERRLLIREATFPRTRREPVALNMMTREAPGPLAPNSLNC